MEHDWFNRSWFHTGQEQCKRCGVIRDETERNLPSQGTQITVNYYYPGKRVLDGDVPDCVERDA